MSSSVTTLGMPPLGRRVRDGENEPHLRHFSNVVIGAIGSLPVECDCPIDPAFSDDETDELGKVSELFQPIHSRRTKSQW
jgi:hypothetical protein